MSALLLSNSLLSPCFSVSISISLYLTLHQKCRGICARCVYHHGREGEQSLLFQRNKSPLAARRTGVKTCEMKFTNGHHPVFILTANLNGPLKFSWCPSRPTESPALFCSCQFQPTSVQEDSWHGLGKAQGRVLSHSWIKHSGKTVSCLCRPLYL